MAEEPKSKCEKNNECEGKKKKKRTRIRSNRGRRNTK